MCFDRKRKPRKYLEFVIHNWNEANALNPMTVPDLDAGMVEAGAIPVGERDTPQGAIYRVEIMRDDLDPQDLLEIFAGLGFQVEVVGKD